MRRFNNLLFIAIITLTTTSSFAALCILEMVAEVNAYNDMIEAEQAYRDGLAMNLSTPQMDILITNLNDAMAEHDQAVQELEACQNGGGGAIP